MKKIFMLLFAMTMLYGMAFAIDGLSVGVEYGIFDFEAEEISSEMDLRFHVGYEGSYVDDALELEAEVGFVMQNFDDMANGLDFEVEARYFLNLGAASKLGLILNSITHIPFDEEKYLFVDEPYFGFVNKAQSWLRPGVKYGQEFNFGNLFLQVDVPFIVVDDLYDALDIVGLDFTLSILNERDERNGFGGEIKMINILKHEEDPDIDFARQLNITPFWGSGNFYAEVEVTLPLMEDGFDALGLDIVPKFEMNLPAMTGLSLWVEGAFRMVGADWDDAPIIGASLGATFKF